MPFSQEIAHTPTSIGIIRFALSDFDGSAANKNGVIRIEVLDQNGIIMKEVSVGMKEVLPAPVLLTISNFMDSVRTQAVAEIL